MEEKKRLLADYGFLKIAPVRKKVFGCFKCEKLPSEIKRETSLCFSSVSRTLFDLKKRGLVELLDVGEERFRLYGLTERGSLVYDKIQAAEMSA